MREYPELFHLRVCRAIKDVKSLEALLEQMHDMCQRDEEGLYKAVTDYDLASLEVLSKGVKLECDEARREMKWYQNQKVE